MQHPDIPPEILKIVPGAFGAIFALRWVVGTPLQRLTSFIGGCAASYYGTEHLAARLGTSDGFTGFLIGLFGMAVAAKLFETLHEVKPADIIAWARKKWGL